MIECTAHLPALSWTMLVIIILLMIVCLLLFRKIDKMNTRYVNHHNEWVDAFNRMRDDLKARRYPFN